VNKLTEDHEAHTVAIMRDIRAKIETLVSPASGAPDRR